MKLLQFHYQLLVLQQKALIIRMGQETLMILLLVQDLQLEQ